MLYLECISKPVDTVRSTSFIEQNEIEQNASIYQYLKQTSNKTWRNVIGQRIPCFDVTVGCLGIGNVRK